LKNSIILNKLLESVWDVLLLLLPLLLLLFGIFRLDKNKVPSRVSKNRIKVAAPICRERVRIFVCVDVCVCVRARACVYVRMSSFASYYP